MDLGLLAAILGAFVTMYPSLFVDGRFEGEGDDRALVVPGGIGADIRLHGRIAGLPDGERLRVRTRPVGPRRAPQRNKWITTAQTVGELRILLGERARKLND